MKARVDDDRQNLTVFYDGSCPLCTAEIAHYQRADRDGRLVLVDVSSPAFQGDAQITQSQAMARFHVRRADGEQLSGARGFVALWAVIPGWRWLARIARWPGVTPCLEWAYRGFLPLRPALVRLFLRLRRSARDQGERCCKGR